MSLTLIKCKNPTTEDLQKLRTKVINGESLDNDDVEIEILENKYESLTLVRVGDDNYQPSADELESWKKLFEEAQYDKDFKIFTHAAISVEQLNAVSKNDMIVIGSNITIVDSQKSTNNTDKYFAEILRSLVTDSNQLPNELDPSEERQALITALKTRLRTMAKKGYTNACWNLGDLPWFIEDIEAAVKYLSESGLDIVITEDQTITAFW